MYVSKCLTCPTVPYIGHKDKDIKSGMGMCTRHIKRVQNLH
jgi:hypothetical protein